MKVYFDNAATTPVSASAQQAVLACMDECWGNPSSIHSAGRAAGMRLDEARRSVARCLGAEPSEISFTSGGTEADNWAITQCAALGARQGKKHLITTAFEHHAVLHTVQRLEQCGFEVTYLPVHSDGLVCPEELEQAIRPDTALVSIMYANNEIGTIQPVAELGEICRAHGVFFHTDAVQAAGHLPIHVSEQKIDLMSLSGHKFHGPKGIGALYCRRGIKLSRLLEGGGQERGKRAGTENLPGICGMAAALEEADICLEENSLKVTALRERLIQGILALPGTRLNGDREQRLPGNANFCFDGIDGESLLLRLDMAGICASAGSACTSGSLEPSHVLLALGLNPQEASSALRFSLDIQNTEEEVDFVIAKISELVLQMRQLRNSWS